MTLRAPVQEYGGGGGTRIELFLEGAVRLDQGALNPARPYVAFFSVVGFTLIGHLFGTQGRVSADTLCGALAVYLILGIIWACAYAMLEAAAPGSFSFGVLGGLSESRFERFLGFSFTTLTTLGYGNVSPATPKADALSTMEAIVGQCYLAIVIARLVALQIAQAKP